VPNPPPWPDRPDSAEDWDLFWMVRALPPDPFPDESYDYGADPRFGPPGTRWVFTIESLINRQTLPGTSQGAKLAIDRLIKKLGTKLPPAGSTSWATPLALAGPAEPVEMELGTMMRWIRTAITGTLGADEQVVHVLNWRHSTEENAPVDNATLLAVGGKVRDAWAAFLGTSLPPNSQTIVRGLPNTLTYRDVRTSVIEQDAPGAKPRWPGQTQYVPFGAGGLQGQETGPSLPYEVAMGISLNTNFRGTSRFRGRLYFGPLSLVSLGLAGQFDKNYADRVGAAFGTSVIQGVAAATDYECHIISQKYSTSAAVTGVRMGVTPDSQRRRRRSRPEGYTQVWGTPVGGA
jgi:hypothetical protein